ncbi:MAG: hypothetical protein ACI4I1_06655 [Oscillospiraceae bacterium]
MTIGLVKERKTIFIKGYAVQWFFTILKNTKVMIYTNIHNNKYVLMTEITLDYVADDFSVESVAKEKIAEIESL